MTQLIPTDSTQQASANQRNLRRLVVSVQASLHKLNLLIAICDNPRYRDELIRTYEAELTAKGITCYQIQLDRQQPSLKQSLLDWQVHTPNWQNETSTLVTMRGGDELLGVRLQQPKSAQERFFFSVQWTREGLRDFHFPIVLWVTQAVAQGLAQQSPDFWSWRGGVFEFDQPMSWQTPDHPQQIERQPESTHEPLANLTELEQQIAALQAEDPDSPLLASLYQSLGATYYQRLKRGIAVNRPQEEAKAIAAFQSAIARRESLTDSTLLATSLNSLAALYRSQGRYSEAEPLLVRSLSIYEQQLGAEHPDVASSLNNLAELYRVQKRYEEAETLYVRALQIREEQLGRAVTLNNLGLLYCEQGRYSEAEPLLLEAIEIDRELLGEEHPDLATDLHNLALVYREQGRYSEAESLFLQALQLKQRTLSNNHPLIADSLYALGSLYKRQNRYSEAETFLTQALDIDRHVFENEHPKIVEDLNALAELYRAQER
jgi:tetratricopeptide (TPR) repeat protein